MLLGRLGLGARDKWKSPIKIKAPGAMPTLITKVTTVKHKCLSSAI